MRFQNKVILISGASSGIGKALALAFIAEGANVALCARDLQKLTQAFASVDHNKILLHQADVSVYEECERFVQSAQTRWGRIDGVINNAGVSMRALFEDLDLSVLHNLMNINFWGTVHLTKAALPHIMKSKGIITGVSSIAGYRGLPARTGYSASKFAMQGFLEALRTELLHTGVHVMWVSPGFTASNIRNTALSADGTAQKETPLKEEKLMSAEACAALIVAAMAGRKRTLVMTRQGKLAVWLNKLIPSFVDKQVYNLFLKEPDSPLRKYESVI
ncbi:SDR family oxidoreductase [Rurimicrobium arvi]|uniref:SDR family oxidoreductase n=1 Tax=Rurimicrobium arvi TaxID=2049916 RepID=A0ABP8MC44_9BACT